MVRTRKTQTIEDIAWFALLPPLLQLYYSTYSLAQSAASRSLPSISGHFINMHFQALSLALLAVAGSAMPHSAEDMLEHTNHQLHELVLNQAKCPEGQNSVNGNGVQYCYKGDGNIQVNNEKVTVPDYCSKMEPTQSQTTKPASTNGTPAPTASTEVASATATASSSTKAPSMSRNGTSSAATATATATAKSGASRMVTGASVLLTTLVGIYLVN